MLLCAYTEVYLQHSASLMIDRWRHFVKWVTKTASASHVKLFVELKSKTNDFTSDEVKPCQILKKKIWISLLKFVEQLMVVLDIGPRSQLARQPRGTHWHLYLLHPRPQVAVVQGAQHSAPRYHAAILSSSTLSLFLFQLTVRRVSCGNSSL